ncbi:MAG: AgmX/PglI C-terminal domain-containing protein [Myxococcales bacterium]|nr:AgmX/PglI C-terminal domain-containing protein [Myxococcales bacterium]
MPMEPSTPAAVPAALPEGPAEDLSLPALRERIEGLEARGDTEAALADMDVFVYRFAAAPSTARYRETLRAHGREPRTRPPVRRGLPPGERLWQPRAPVGRPVARLAPPIIRGSIDPSLVRRALMGRMHAWRTCYERGLNQNPNLAGTVAFRFPILADGRVPNTRVTGGTLRDAATRQCTTTLAQRLRFPASNIAGVNLIDVELRFLTE